MKKVFFIIGVIIFIILIGAFLVFFSPKKNKSESQKITVISTLFPTYDFAKNIGGDKIDVLLLLPPGVEPHSFEPKPSDIAKINNADVFIYTGEFMEPWAHDIIEGADTKVKIVDSSKNVNLLKQEEEHEHEHEHETDSEEGEEHHHDHNGVDPHIWLDFDNAKIMAGNIAKALEEIDPKNAEYYQSNLITYQQQLTDLDNLYKKDLSICKTKTIIYGGHYAFGYLAKKYGLNYEAAQGLSPDAEPSAKDLISLVDQIKEENIKYVFYEELSSPKIAETIAKETNAKLLLLNGAHNLPKEDLEKNTSFISIIESNLNNLKLGLSCE